jgi:hypothetical protein
MMIFRSAALALGMLALLGAGQTRANPAIPPGYQNAYAQGCASGFADAGRDGYMPAKHIGRYAADGDYRRAWDEGHQRCYAEQQRHPKVFGGN